MQVTQSVVVVKMDIEETLASLPDDISGVFAANLYMAYVEEKPPSWDDRLC